MKKNQVAIIIFNFHVFLDLLIAKYYDNKRLIV